MFKRNQPGDSPQRSIDTLIGRATRIEGDVTFSGGFHLDGQVAGNVRADSSTTSVLSVSEHGAIEGSVDVPHVVLNGTVTGDIHARERVELGAKARVNGNVHYAVIEMAMGASINGKLVHEVDEASQTEDDPLPSGAKA